jgi:hypothetical protein
LKLRMATRNPKLVVIGCSFSARTRVSHCYGDYLSELLGIEYMHLAKGASSNDRTWRVLTKHILDGTITSDDLVIVQYTDMHRREFPSYGHNYEVYYDPASSMILGPIEKYQSSFAEEDVYFVSHYKADSHLWQANDADAEIHCAYQKNCSVEEFDLDYFYTRHQQFEAFCKVNNIKLILFWTRYTHQQTDFIVKMVGEYGRKFLLLENSYLRDLPEQTVRSYELGHDGGNPDIWDGSHLNETGHKFTAERLFDHIQEKRILETSQ